MDEKTITQSKTIIFNVATAIVAIGAALQGLDFMPPKAVAAITAIVAIANIALRFTTTKPIVLRSNG